MVNKLVLTNDNYYSLEANNEFFSVSQFKDFMKCEAAALAKIKGEYKQPTTKALLVGSFVDSYFEGTLKQFLSENPEIFTRKNELKSEFKKANGIIQRVTSDPLFMKFMGGEKQKIFNFNLFGVDWKMKADSYIKNVCIADLKVVANFKTLPLWRYDIQGAIYQRGVEICTGQKLPFYLAVATKEKVVDLDIFQIPQSILDTALEDVELMIDRFASVKNGKEQPIYCGECDYCKSVKKAKIRSYVEIMGV